jgi:hypothetical protein
MEAETILCDEGDVNGIQRAIAPSLSKTFGSSPREYGWFARPDLKLASGVRLESTVLPFLCCPAFRGWNPETRLSHSKKAL